MAKAKAGRTASGRIKKGFKLTPGGRVVKATKSKRKQRRRRRR
jgi:hypothetical protein